MPILQERTPIKITEKIHRLCRELDSTQKPAFVKVRPEPTAQIGECVLNVKNKISKHHGKILNGWSIWEWPNILIEAEFHSIWVSPEGEMVDVSPKQKNVDKILFLSDSTDKYNYDSSFKRIDNIRKPLCRDPVVKEFINACHEIFEFEQKVSPGPVIRLEGEDLLHYEALKKRKFELISQIVSSHAPLLTNEKPGRNDLCPCGSGKKYKRCCAKRAIPIIATQVYNKHTKETVNQS